VNAVDQAVHTKLVAGTALITTLGGTAIYWRVANQGAAYPYVVFFQSAGTDENSSPRRAKRVTYTVKAVSPDPNQAGVIDDAIDALLHRTTLTVTGWGNYRTARQNDVEYEEKTDAGEIVFHRGAQYGIWIAE
jgi:hypothetical protein